MCDAKRHARVEHSENVERAHEEPSVAEWPRLKAEGDKEDEEAQRRKSEMSLKELEEGKKQRGVGQVEKEKLVHPSEDGEQLDPALLKKGLRREMHHPAFPHQGM